MAERLVGNYRIGELLGRGGMGDVYRAEHQLMERKVACKFMAASLLGDEEFLKRFLREADLMLKLTHPNIVRLLDCGEDGGVPYLLMELLDGETLHQRLKRDGALPEEEAVRIATGILSGLSCAHQEQIVHRDVKPGNIFLCEGGGVKVMDFGVAKAAMESRLTRTGSQIGTAEYMSPEQADGLPVDARSDIYSAGIVLYQMVSGRVPFTGENSLAVLHQHVHKAPPPLPSSVSPWLRGVVERGLSKKPAARYQTADAMRMALESGLASQKQSSAKRDEKQRLANERRRDAAQRTGARPGAGRRVAIAIAAAACLAGAVAAASGIYGRWTSGKSLAIAAQAWTAMTRGRLADAVKLGREAVALDQKNPDARAALGAALLETQRGMEFSSRPGGPGSLKSKLTPSEREGYDNVGNAVDMNEKNARANAADAGMMEYFVEQKLFAPEALADVRKQAAAALHADPHLAYAYVVLSEVDRLEKKTEDAILDADRALAADPLMANAHLQRGLALLSDEKYRGAEQEGLAEEKNGTASAASRKLVADARAGASRAAERTMEIFKYGHTGLPRDPYTFDGSPKPASVFRASTEMTRNELAMLLYKELHPYLYSGPAEDAPDPHMAVSALVALHVIQGGPAGSSDENGYFDEGKRPMTEGECMMILYRVLTLPRVHNALVESPAAGAVRVNTPADHWAFPAESSLRREGIILASELVSPNANVTSATASSWLARLQLLLRKPTVSPR